MKKKQQNSTIFLCQNFVKSNSAKHLGLFSSLYLKDHKEWVGSFVQFTLTS